MAGFSFGASRWDDIPQALGLGVEGGVLTGAWNGVTRVRATFYNEHVPASGGRDDYYNHYTTLSAVFDPPLLMGVLAPRRPGVDAAHYARVFDPQIVHELDARTKALGLAWDATDEALSGTWSDYE